MSADERPAPLRTGAGPSEIATARKLLAAQSTQPDLLQALRPLRWAHALMHAVDGPIPNYGSPEWHALPDNSRAKVAACVIAAEAWRTYWSPDEHALRLAIELDERVRQDQDEADLDELGWTPTLTRAQRASYARPRPSFAELCERRGEPEKAAHARARNKRIATAVITGA